MWKTGTRALGVLALVLASSVTVGQEKPKVVVEKPITRQKILTVESRRQNINGALGARVWNVVIHIQGMDVVLNAETAQRIAYASSNLEPLMVGGLKPATEEMERALKAAQSDELEGCLSALETLGKAVMEARRVLRTERQALVEAAEQAAEDASGLEGTWRSILVHQVAESPPTPLAKAWSAVQDGVSSVRQAFDIDEIKLALDDVEQSVAALRALLWEQKPKKG